MGDIDVMISLHCASMASSAKKLKEYLESRGMVVWVCIEMSGGENYRDSIVDAIDRAEVVVIMLNEEWALSGECQDEYNYAKRLNLTSYESGRSERGQARLPVFCPIAFKNLNWGSHKHVRLLAANTNFIVHDGDNLLGDVTKARQTFEGVATTLESIGKVLKDPISDGDTGADAIAAVTRGIDVTNEISALKDGLKALTARVLELESKSSSTTSTQIPLSFPRQDSAAGTEPRQMISGPIQLGSNYLGNTLSEIQLFSKIKGEMIYGLQAYYSITFSNLVHNQATGEVNFDATRKYEGIEWAECTQLNLSQDVKDELSKQYKDDKVIFAGNGTGTFNQTQRRLIVNVPDWTPNQSGLFWSQERIILAAHMEGELVGFCSGDSTIVMKEF